MSYLLLKDCIGKDRGWKVNQMTVELWSRKVDNDAFFSTSNYAAVYGGLVANCYLKQEEPDFTHEQVCDYVDSLNETEEGLAVMNKIKELFEASQYYIKLLHKTEGMLREMEEVGEEDKKKAIMTNE